MQQTDKYKLNKPGVDDPITPVPLNENMDKIEAALLTKADAALEQRVTVLEAHKVMVGSYIGDGTTRVIDLGYNPKVLILYFPYPFRLTMMLQGYSSGDGARLEENGFWLGNGGYYNKDGGKYYYVAIV